ncbi:hypothetical protein ATCC90586_006148 [Pythium insidiosum]|nr:hypothetical protein ATCC90586_006148 [Pythium insidiosum]
MDDERQKLLARHRRQQVSGLQPFGAPTWSRCVLSVVTYALFLSDVIRTGVGIPRLSLATVEPGVSMLFGPFSYPVVHLTTANATQPAATKRFWPYKYDTTSLGMRAVAQALQLPKWPACVRYESTCDETSGLPGAVIFEMLDELIARVREQTTAPPDSRLRSAAGRSLTLRLEHQRRDRLSEAVLPSVFYRTQRRTCQASFYPLQRLRSHALCAPFGVHPFSCVDPTSNFGRLCGAKPCSRVGRIHEHISGRVAMLQRAYPNASLELVVLDSAQDFSRGGLVSHGRRDFDIVTLVRIRECRAAAAANCSTIAVDDYRYEGIVFASSEREWFPIVALLRATGQVYAWLRVAALVAAVVAVERVASTSPLAKTWSVVRTVFVVIPSHVVVYGAIVPVSCYATAHLLDSNLVYEQIRADFYALLGGFRFDVSAFFRLASISMRTVWLIASACQCIVSLSTRRSWTRELGIAGVPELFIAFVSSFTVLAHIRIPNWRDCRVLQVHRVVASHRTRDVRSFVFDKTRAPINALFLGASSDYQFIAVGLAAVAAIAVIAWVVMAAVQYRRRYRLAIVSHTRVPYTAAWLWPAHALVVNWLNAITEPSAAAELATPRANGTRKVSRILTVSVRRLDVDASTVYDQLLELEQRSRHELAYIVTLNLTVMSDPLVFYRLRQRGSRQLVAMYEDQVRGKQWLLPLQSSSTLRDAPFAWEELRRVARQTLLARHRRQQVSGLQPFGTLTWSRCVLSVITYGLFLSDVVRTGLGVRRLSLTSVEPGVRMMFGPYNYPVVHLTTTNASLPTSKQRYWTYKHDTTSLSMRATAKTLETSAWPACVHHEATCDETAGLPGALVFEMLDELIAQVRDAVSADHRSRTWSDSLTLRITHEYRDRLNEAVLPSIFYRSLRRTCQASFFTSAQLVSRPLCDPRAAHPFSCLDAVSGYDRLCSDAASCPGVGPIQQRIRSHLSALQRAYPNASLDIVVLDSVQDYARAALVSHGRRDFDVVTLVRVRECNQITLSCTTIAVDDYRYEGSVLTSSETEWFPIVAMLRAIGQLYAWSRFASFIVALIVVEHAASATFVQKLWAVLRTFLFVPGHIVVYGSIIPVACYATAHLLDSSVVYEKVREDFSVLEGLFSFNVVNFIRSATISMRNPYKKISARLDFTESLLPAKGDLRQGNEQQPL